MKLLIVLVVLLSQLLSSAAHAGNAIPVTHPDNPNYKRWKRKEDTRIAKEIENARAAKIEAKKLKDKNDAKDEADRLERERKKFENARIAREEQIAEEARASLDLQVVAAQAELDAQTALDAQIAATRAGTYAQTTRNIAQLAVVENRFENRLEVIQAGHAQDLRSLYTIIGVLCFPGETPISVKDDFGYHTAQIESIKVGDSVVSCNLALMPHSCEVKQVQHLFQNTADHLIKFNFGGKTLKTTENHPFYIMSQGWVPVRNLTEGNLLQNISGSSVAIEKIEHEYGEFQVFNLDGEDHHNDYASDILVHNCTAGLATGISRFLPNIFDYFKNQNSI